ncbi:DUF7310 family coiled-coil domain-containing protein [Natranaeroarchaeum aerophilus]|uniref:DUF7310 domain-containing protein n=1 Tax=Natranaeroarchaeum aerophilus TaxID=2917711 RepID=A0AAE3FPU9_9EURY|nr:hypothetical protein [Natranaeroarchaeum aerophilus]MCL9812900.1 hypothetical protein [Natranaeroarchaeum aerophilus]
MTDIDRLDQRLSAVERVVVDGDVSLDELSELTELAETVAELENRVKEQEQRIAELEATAQSIEGYVGNVESVNEEVERQAATAVATVDRLERQLDAIEVELDDLRGGVLLEDEGDADASNEDEEPGDEADDDSEFVFLQDEPTPERAIDGIVDEEPTATVDDGMDRPVSTADQETVDTAVSEEPATTATGDEEDDGLFTSLRSKFG